MEPNVKRIKVEDLSVFEALQLPIGPGHLLAGSYRFCSPVPEGTDDDGGYVVGVDEAGRGPVMGPMVYAACFCKEARYQALSSLGFADSKQLTDAQRWSLFLALQGVSEYAGFSLNCLSPQDISHSMLRRSKHNLNSMAHDATIQMIRDLIKQGVRVARLFVDTVGPPHTYQKKLQELFPQTRVTVAKKADSLYPVVSAASVCAKVVRDAHIKHWVFRSPNDMELGSGYPGDPATVRWLNEKVDPVFGFPSIIRFSWSTCAKLLEERAIRVCWPTAEEEKEKEKGKEAKLKFIAKTRPPQKSRWLSTHKSIKLQ